MNCRLMIIVLLTFLALTGCYLPMSGRVIDAETNEPIEGAVVVVEWAIQHGFGLTYHTVYKIAETETDKKGRFSLPGAYNPFVDEPELVIYKRGYVVWSNRGFLTAKNDENGKIEMVGEKRTDYDVWEHGYVYKLGLFKEGYSHYMNYQLMNPTMMGLDVSKTPHYLEAIRIEHQAAEPELEILRRKWRGQ